MMLDVAAAAAAFEEQVAGLGCLDLSVAFAWLVDTTTAGTCVFVAIVVAID